MTSIAYFWILLFIQTLVPDSLAKHSISSPSNSSCLTPQPTLPDLPSLKSTGPRFKRTSPQTSPGIKQRCLNQSDEDLNKKISKASSQKNFIAGFKPEGHNVHISSNKNKARCTHGSRLSFSHQHLKQKDVPLSWSLINRDRNRIPLKYPANKTYPYTRFDLDTLTNIINRKLRCSSSLDCSHMSQETRSSNDLPVKSRHSNRLHKTNRLYRRDADFRRYWKTPVATDHSNQMSGLFPSTDSEKRADNLLRVLQKYPHYSSVVSKLTPEGSFKGESDDTDGFYDIHTRNHPEEPMEVVDDDIHTRNPPEEPIEVVDDDIEQALDLLGQYVLLEQTVSDVSGNRSSLPVDQQTFILESGVNNKISVKGERPNARVSIKHHVGESTARDSDSLKCRHSPMLRALSDHESFRYLPAPCLTDTRVDESNTRAITKKSVEPLQENSETQSIVTTEFQSCHHYIETKVIALQGCVPKSVLITRCHGTCSSRSVPEWSTNENDVQQIEHCTCCSPLVMKFRTLRFRCPRRREGTLVLRLGFPFRCACRPCSSTPEVTAEQPYDY